MKQLKVELGGVTLANVQVSSLNLLVIKKLLKIIIHTYYYIIATQDYQFNNSTSTLF